MNAPQKSPSPDDVATSGYTACAQLLKMLLPSSGSLVIYASDGELVWCADGYERPDFHDLVVAFRGRQHGAEANLGQLSKTYAGASVLVAKLCDDADALLGYALIELGAAHSAAGNSMAASLTRPLLSCLATQLALERTGNSDLAPAAEPGDPRMRFLLGLTDIKPGRPSAIRELLDRCVDQLDCMSAVLCIPDQDLTEVAERESQADGATRAKLDGTRKHLLAWAQLNNRPMVVNGIDNASTSYKILSCPVSGYDNDQRGLLALFRSASSPNFELDDVALAEILASHAMALITERQDALTGLMSRPAFERRIDRALAERAAEDGEPGILLYLDLIDLAAINEALGYDAGDEAIVRTGQLIRRSLATAEAACRLAGDRFVLHLPDCSLDAARARVTELIESVADLEYDTEDRRMPLSLKFGLAEAPAASAAGRHWIAAAERACREP